MPSQVATSAAAEVPASRDLGKGDIMPGEEMTLNSLQNSQTTTLQLHWAPNLRAEQLEILVVDYGPPDTSSAEELVNQTTLENLCEMKITVL